MNHWVCLQVEAGSCVQWAESTSILYLPDGAGVKIGLALLGVSALAWGVRMVARVILNR